MNIASTIIVSKMDRGDIKWSSGTKYSCKVVFISEMLN